jgi:hypothetical protein
LISHSLSADCTAGVVDAGRSFCVIL